MARQQSIVQILRWDIALLLVLIGAASLWTALDDPYLDRAENPRQAGSRPPERSEGDILLLLPDVPSAEASKFSELDCSYSWYNSLWQEFGTFGTALTRQLNPELLAGRSVVIVPRRVAEAMPSAGVSALAGFVRRGGQIVIEMPPVGWEMLTGISAARKLRVAQRITSVEGLGVHGPMRKHLPNVPLSGKLQLAPKLKPYPSGPMLLAVDGQPGWIVNPLGKGQVHTLLFEFGCTITAMQQGKPSRAMQFKRREGERYMLSSERSWHPRLEQNRVPYADLLERALFKRLSEHRPLPRLWLYPNTMAGALMVTHPTQQSTRAALGFADSARRREGRSTVFVAPDALTTTQAALFEQSQAELGLLWVLGEQRAPAIETYGFGALRPLARELDLQSQITMLNLRATGTERLRIAKIEGKLIEPTWSTSFEQLAAASVRLDASFGPVQREEFGYLFGSGFPYYPMDQRGLLLPLLEAPYVLHGPSLNPKRLEQFLGDSKVYFHQPLQIDLPSHIMRTAPSAGILLALREAFAMARQHNHWVCTVSEFTEFLAARRRSVLTSQWFASERRLVISANVLGARVDSLEGGAFAGVTIPRTHDGEEIGKVILDGQELPLRALATTGPSFDRILKVTPGRHQISIYYGPQQEEPEEPEEQEGASQDSQPRRPGADEPR